MLSSHFSSALFFLFILLLVPVKLLFLPPMRVKVQKREKELNKKAKDGRREAQKTVSCSTDVANFDCLPSLRDSDWTR